MKFLVFIILLLSTTCQGFAFLLRPPVTRTNTHFAAARPGEQATTDRRVWLEQAVVLLFTTTRAAQAATPPTKILVLGGTGFVGQRIVNLLRSSRDIEVIATSTNGRDGTIAFDVVTSEDISNDIERLAKDCTAVISTIGSIGNGALDGTINAGSGDAARGAKRANVERFVYISVAPEVVDFAKDIEFLQPYMNGKLQSEQVIRTEFPGSTLIKPTFIYGGDEFKVNPPRVAGFYGSFIESVLASSPLRALTNVAPEGIIKIALEPPVSVDTVAQAAVAAALGKTTMSTLDTYDKIRDAAAQLQ